jgi:hypothetical protein
MFTIHPCTKFQMHVSNGSLAIDIKQTTKNSFRATTTSFFYFLQTNYHNKSRIFFEALLPYIISASNIKCCFRLQISYIRHVVITEYVTFESTRLQRPPTAWRSYMILWKSLVTYLSFQYLSYNFLFSENTQISNSTDFKKEETGENFSSTAGTSRRPQEGISSTHLFWHSNEQIFSHVRPRRTPVECYASSALFRFHFLHLKAVHSTAIFLIPVNEPGTNAQ